jgi:hypothetical protein
MELWLEAAAADASRQESLVTWQQLRSAGASEKSIAGLVRRGWLVRERPAVYSFVGAPRTWRHQLLGAVLSAGRGAVASHSCAATLWEFRHLPYLTFEVSVDDRCHHDIDGVTVHRVMTLPDDDVTTVGGIPVTTFERTLVDCTTALSPFQLSTNLDDGLRRDVASLRRLRECVERLASGPGRRLSVIRSLLDDRPTGYHPGGSRSERRILDVLRHAGLPLPVQQHRVRVDGKTYYLDFAYPQRRAFIEYYGLAWHGTPSAVVYDSERISALTTLHWQPLLFTDRTPDGVIVDQVRRVLASPRRSVPSVASDPPEREGETPNPGGPGGRGSEAGQRLRVSGL